MRSRTARKITDAEVEEGMRCEQCDARDPRLIDEVEAMWNRFATAQNTPPLERPWLDQIKEAGGLDVVAAKDRAGLVLAGSLFGVSDPQTRAADTGHLALQKRADRRLAQGSQLCQLSDSLA